MYSYQPIYTTYVSAGLSDIDTSKKNSSVSMDERNAMFPALRRATTERSTEKEGAR